MRQAGRLQELYVKHGDKADFWWIYIQEAHATDGRRPSQDVKIALHKTIDDRKAAATSCSAVSPLKVPVLVDTMDEAATKAYSALPERFFILGTEGKMVYSGKRGPHGIDLDALEKSLIEYTGKKTEEE
ncbi:MAG: deiodinase-like protein [Akkermansiaceae bacterium]